MSDSDTLLKKYMVPTEQLRRCVSVAEITDAESVDPEIIGQEDAIKVIELGLQMQGDVYLKKHYNILVVGEQDTGRTKKTIACMKRHAEQIIDPPPDTITFHNFEKPKRYIITTVPNGAGKEMKKRLEGLATYSIDKIPKIADLLRQNALKDLEKQLQTRAVEHVDRIQALGCNLYSDGSEPHPKIVLISLKNPTEVMGQEEYDELEADIREELQKRKEQAEEILKTFLKENAKIMDEAMKRTGKTERGVIKAGVQKHIDELKALAPQNEPFTVFLEHLAQICRKYYLMEDEDGHRKETLKKLCTTVILSSHEGHKHPPVVPVDVPSFPELFGSNDSEWTKDGVLRADHTTMEDGGAVLKANHGYLFLDLDLTIRSGYLASFIKLLDVLKKRKLQIESRHWSRSRSEEVDIDIRVVACCTRYLAMVLRHFFPKFADLFRIVAEFDSSMEAKDAPAAYAAFVEVCRQEANLTDFTPEAVAKIVEYGFRRAGSQRDASAEFGLLKDLIMESAHLASADGSPAVFAHHIRSAIKARYDRETLAVRKYHKFFDLKQLNQSEGTAVGQINGLVVLSMRSGISFGLPQRITARAFAGPEKIVLVQRDAGLSGPLSDTAISVIRGYLSGTYGQKKPLSLSVQLCFEQCYGGVDGDSATIAEVIASLSAVTGLPVRQDLVITGSMNQHGEVQPIGGVNEKLEGHFDGLIRSKTLKPGHGAVIPVQNIQDLMLKEEIPEAQKNGRYQVYAVSHVDQALELFFGLPAEDVHTAVRKRLKEMRRNKKSKNKKKKEKTVEKEEETKDSKDPKESPPPENE